MGMMVQLFQFLNVFASFGVAWPGSLSAFLGFFSVVALDVSSLGMSCTLGNSEFVAGLMRIFLPCVALGFIFVWALLLNKLDKVPYSGDAVVNAMGMLWGALFISLCIGAASMFQCAPHPEHYDGKKEEQLTNFPGVLCWSDDHFPFLIVGTLCVIFCAVLPLAASIRIANVGRHYPEKFNTARYFFLCARYGIKGMHWAVMAMVRNVILAFLPIVVWNPALQLILFSLVTMSYGWVVATARPWVLRVIDLLDSFILLGLSFMAGTGMSYLEDMEYAKKISTVSAFVFLASAFTVIICIFGFNCWVAFHPPKPVEVNNNEPVRKSMTQRLMTAAFTGMTKDCDAELEKERTSMIREKTVRTRQDQSSHPSRSQSTYGPGIGDPEATDTTIKFGMDSAGTTTVEPQIRYAAATEGANPEGSGNIDRSRFGAQPSMAL